jgi:hypothetical protein
MEGRRQFPLYQEATEASHVGEINYFPVMRSLQNAHE